MYVSTILLSMWINVKTEKKEWEKENRSILFIICKKKRFQGIKLKDWDTQPKKYKEKEQLCSFQTKKVICAMEDG